MHISVPMTCEKKTAGHIMYSQNYGRTAKRTYQEIRSHNAIQNRLPSHQQQAAAYLIILYSLLSVKNSKTAKFYSISKRQQYIENILLIK